LNISSVTTDRRSPFAVRRSPFTDHRRSQDIGNTYPKNANGGAENRVVLLRRKHLRINGFSPGRSIAERWDYSDAESLAPFRLPPFPFLGLLCKSRGSKRQTRSADIAAYQGYKKENPDWQREWKENEKTMTKRCRGNMQNGL
jgi:hypothetical protein